MTVKSKSVRYADDCNIYVRSERAGQRVMESVRRFITKRLQLKVNEKKSAVARPQVRKFLGFRFTDVPVIRRTIAPKAVERFKERIREITWQARSVSLDQTMVVLAPYMRGWRGYFGFCEIPGLLIQLTRWVRLRLRGALWRQWKTSRRRRAMRVRLGVRGALADTTAASSRGPWHLAHSKALSIALSNAYFRSRGFPSLFEQCSFTTLSNRRVRTRTHGGVAGVGGSPPPLCRCSVTRFGNTRSRGL